MFTKRRVLSRVALPIAAAAALLVTPAAAMAAGSGHGGSRPAPASRHHIVQIVALPALTPHASKATAHPASGPEGWGSCAITVGGQSGAGLCGLNPQMIIWSGGLEEELVVGTNRAVYHSAGFPHSLWTPWAYLGGVVNDGIWNINVFNGEMEVRGTNDNFYCMQSLPFADIPAWSGWGGCNFVFPPAGTATPMRAGSSPSQAHKHIVGTATLPPLSPPVTPHASKAPTAPKVTNHPATGPEGSGSCPITVGGQSGAGICGTNPQLIIYSTGLEEEFVVGTNRAIYHSFGYPHDGVRWLPWTYLGGIVNDGIWNIGTTHGEMEVRGNNDSFYCIQESSPGIWSGWGGCNFDVPSPSPS